MARAKITRTITTTNAAVFCVNTDTDETFIKEVSLPGSYKDDTAIFKEAKKRIEAEATSIRPVYVKNYTTDSKLYGISEEDFLAHAVVIKENANEFENN